MSVRMPASRTFFIAVLLESVLHAKLQNPWRALHGRDTSERSEIEVDRRVAPVEVIQQVERFEPQLDAVRGGEFHRARQREVDRPASGSLDRIDRQVAKRA